MTLEQKINLVFNSKTIRGSLDIAALTSLNTAAAISVYLDYHPQMSKHEAIDAISAVCALMYASVHAATFGFSYRAGSLFYNYLKQKLEPL